MSPSTKKQHQKICGALHFAVESALRGKGCTDCEVYFELDWVVNSDTVFRPDLLVVCQDTPSDFVEKTPVMVVEILSDSTRQRDLLYKRESYQHLGVKYYLIVDPGNSSHQLLALGQDGYQTAVDSELHLHEGCSIQLELSSLLGTAQL
jgi:Uma2 family endonuclease